ncbi:retrovirus-related pol polyprotein from transposon TNT 1-94 [Tanacetum coccineum]
MASIQAYYENVGITHQTSVARTPQQKGVVERRNRTLVEATHTMLIFSKAPSGPGTQLMTPATHSSGLVPNPPSLTPSVLPTKKDWEILFQLMFDEYFSPPTSVASLVPAAVAPVPADSTSTPSSTSVDQDAPSPKENHDIEVAHMDNDQYFGIPIPEPSLEESSSQVVIPNNVHSVNQPPKNISKWTKYHPIDNVIGDPSTPVSTRHQIKNEAMFCYFDAFLSSIEPKSYKEAL